MEIKYERILTVDQYKKLGKENYDRLIKLGNIENNNIQFKYPNITNHLKVKKAKEIAFLSSKNDKLSITEKFALTSNIIYSDGLCFCKYVNKVFSLDELKNMSEILKKYKQLKKLYDKLNKSVEFDNQIFLPLFERAKKIYGYTEFEIYFNKINGLIAFEEEKLNSQKTLYL